MQFGSLEIHLHDELFTFTFNGRGLGVGNDLRAFTETRLKNGMASADLIRSLEQLRAAGESNDWNFEKMSGPSASSSDPA